MSDDVVIRERVAQRRAQADAALRREVEIEVEQEHQAAERLEAAKREVGNGGRRGRGTCTAGHTLRLALLAPDGVEAVLGGRAGDPFILENLERPLPASWEAQRDRLGC